MRISFNRCLESTAKLKRSERVAMERTFGVATGAGAAAAEESDHDADDDEEAIRQAMPFRHDSRRSVTTNQPTRKG
jgi:hypothetical protein